MVGTWGTCYCCLEFVYLSGPTLFISTEQDHEWTSMCLLATAPSEFGAQMYSEHAQGLKGAPPDSLFSRFCLHALQFGTCNIRGTKKYHHNFLALLISKCVLHPCYAKAILTFLLLYSNCSVVDWICPRSALVLGWRPSVAPGLCEWLTWLRDLSIAPKVATGNVQLHMIAAIQYFKWIGFCWPRFTV